MAWIESHQDLAQHPKVFSLQAALNADLTTTIGVLHLLWHFTLKFCWRDGDISKYTPAQIAHSMAWKGDPSALIKALQDSGWIDGMVVHDWMDYAGKIVSDRIYNENRRKTATNAVNPRKVSATVPNHTVPNHTVPTPTAQPKKRPSGPVGPADPEVVKLTDLFLELLKAKSGDGVSFPVVRARKFFKTMLKTNTSLHLATTIRNYFDSTDTFIKNSGYSWGSFDIKFNALKGGPIHAGTNQARGNWKNNRIPNQSVVEDGSIYDAKIQR